MNLFDLVAVLTLNKSEYEKGLDAAEQEAEGFGSKAKQAFGTAAKVGAGIATVAAGAVTGMTKLASSSASAMDEIDKASQKIGISTEAYQEWAHAMDLSGMSIDTMKTGMKSLQKAMTGLDEEGNATSEEFQKLGISLTNSDGSMRSVEDVMNDTILALSSMEESAERTTIATKLFGRAGTEMAPLLNSGAEAITEMRQEAHDLGLVFSEEAVKSGAHLNDTMTNLKNSFGAVKTRLGSSLMPVVETFANKLMDFLPRVQEIFDRLAPTLGNMFDKLMPVVFDLADAILPVIFNTMDALMPIFTDVANTVLPIITDIIGKLAPILGQLVETVMPVLQKILEAITPIINTLWPVLSSILDIVLSLLEPLLNIALTALQPIIAALQILNPLFEVVAAVLQPILDLINLILKPVTDFINFLFGDITSGVDDVNNSLGEGGLLGSLGDVSSFLFGDFSDAFNMLGSILGEATSFIGDAFHGIINFIQDPKQALGDFFDWVGGKIETLKGGLKALTEISDVKKETEKAHANMEAASSAWAQAEENGYRKIDNGDGTNIIVHKDSDIWKKYAKEHNIPELAEGAVLEPNKPFMAVVGDQRQGTNVEAPLATIQEAVRNVINSGFYRNQQPYIINHTGIITVRGIDRDGNNEEIYDYVINHTTGVMRRQKRM